MSSLSNCLKTIAPAIKTINSSRCPTCKMTKRSGKFRKFVARRSSMVFNTTLSSGRRVGPHSEYDSWEPADHLTNARRKVKEFETTQGKKRKGRNHNRDDSDSNDSDSTDDTPDLLMEDTRKRKQRRR